MSKYNTAGKCKKCAYRRWFNGDFSTCDYIFIVGHSRPCPPGAECTEYKSKAQYAKEQAALRKTKYEDAVAIREKIKQKNRDYYLKNKEQLLQKQREARQRNKEKKEVIT